MKKFLIIIGSVIVLAAVLVGGVWLDNVTISVNDYMMVSEKIPAGFDDYKIAFLSDFHNAPYVQDAVGKVQSIKPNSIMITGDMINMNEQTYENTTNLLTELVKIAPVYMVSGNHEMYHPDWKSKIRPEFEKIGVKVMDINSAYIQNGGDKIHIYGMQDPSVDDSELGTTEWIKKWEQKAEQEVDKSTYNILLCHRANYFDSLAGIGYDLVLSGHMHGGVIRLPVVGGVMSPESSERFPKYTNGKYYNNDTVLLVNRGMDYNLNRLRIFNGPEIVSVTLKQK